MDQIAAYLCIGDSMSIDVYPYMELVQQNPDAPKEVGAGALLHKNQSTLWSDFDGKDLLSKYPDIQFASLAADGATTLDFMDTDYLDLLPEELRSRPVITTLTICGNDLLGMIGIREPTAVGELDKQMEGLCKRFDIVVDVLTNAFPRAICIFTTIYDPTDGTGLLPSYNFADKLPWFHKMNDYIRESARKRNALLADVHKHFLGHGLSAPERERWYWAPNPIEPSARGASEIRRLWVQALEEEDLL